MPPTQKSSGHRRKSALISQAMEKAILDGEWQPGDRLPSEDALCERFSVSRTVIREAIQQLKARALIHSVQGSGSFISPVMPELLHSSLKLYSTLSRDRQAFLEMMDLRILLETTCVKELAPHIQPDELSAIRAPLEKMRKCRTDLHRFAQEDIAFHLAIAHTAGNRLYDTILGALLPSLGRRYANATYTDTTLIQKNLRDHEEIFDALARGNVKAAVTAMQKHLADSKSHFLEMLDLQEGKKLSAKNKKNL